MVRPWLFLFPTIFVLGVYLAYPVIDTLWISLTDQNGAFIGLANYQQMLGENKFWEALNNNIFWLIVVPAAATAFGLLAAQLTDRIAWGAIAKSLIFMPMAISFVGASVIFKLVYDLRPADSPQIGIINAIWMKFDGGASSTLFLKGLPIVILIAFALFIAYLGLNILKGIQSSNRNRTLWDIVWRPIAGIIIIWLIYHSAHAIFDVIKSHPQYGKPQGWLTIPFWNSIFLMVVLIWIQTGFAMVILSAALRGIPNETIEAAIIDGASPTQVFFKIKVPQIMPTIIVVWTTITLTVLKVFDVVYTMTNGQWSTQVLANYMYNKMFRANEWGVGSASAIIIMLLVTPILIWNLYNARKEMR